MLCLLTDGRLHVPFLAEGIGRTKASKFHQTKEILSYVTCGSQESHHFILVSVRAGVTRHFRSHSDMFISLVDKYAAASCC